jgi:hypothetical protein
VHSAQSPPSRRWPTSWRGSLRLPLLRVWRAADTDSPNAGGSGTE